MFRRITAILLFAATAAFADPPRVPRPDLAKQPTLYVVGYAHLDTQWRWELPRTISEYLPKTMRDNFALFEKYPHYVFNFSGANRYRLMKEYYPADFAKVRDYVVAGRWFPSGSSLEESDVNTPSAESILRQVLYGSEYFRRELGRSSAEYMLPDCFGVPSSLPTHPRPQRDPRLLDAETRLGILRTGRRRRIDREHARRHAVQRRRLGRARRGQRPRRVQSRQLQRGRRPKTWAAARNGSRASTATARRAASSPTTTTTGRAIPEARRASRRSRSSKRPWRAAAARCA